MRHREVSIKKEMGSIVRSHCASVKSKQIEREVVLIQTDTLCLKLIAGEAASISDLDMQRP